MTASGSGGTVERALDSLLNEKQAPSVETSRLEALNEIAKVLASDLDLERIVQAVTERATQLSGAKFGAFFYNLVNPQGESYTLYSLSGAPREAFDKFGLPRNTPVFEPTFRGTGIVRSDDIRLDPRYGHNSPHQGMPKGHLPVVSYLAVPVISRSGTVHGGLFFAHDQAGVFTQAAEDLVAGIAAHAALAIDNAHLYEAQKRLAAIIENSADAIISKNLSSVITSWNKGAERLFGYAASEVVGKSITLIIPADRQHEEPKILERVKRGEQVEHYETVRKAKDGTLIDISLSISPIKDLNGQIIGASKIARDITERRKAQEAQQLLIGELNHRVKNTLATVQAIATQTLGSATSEERDGFIARLHALAHAHDSLASGNWVRAPLADLLARALQPFPSDRFVISGPPVTVNAQKALLLTMTVHELATNAAKYGALSNNTGRVHIGWVVAEEDDRRALQFSWKELGGPLVQPPSRKGFGSRLIEASLDRTQIDFSSEGLSCRLDLKLD